MDRSTFYYNIYLLIDYYNTILQIIPTVHNLMGLMSAENGD